MVGSLAVTATSVNGSISYDTVGLDGNSCAISDSLTAQQVVASRFDFGSVRAEFGPACGDVQLYN